MKIVIINGSARKGNTLTAIEALTAGMEGKHEVEMIQADQLKMGFCKGCGACQCMNGCVDRDDTNPTIDKIVAADLVVFTSPVYWWGITAQLKLVIDKCYCRGFQLKGKKIGVIIVGGSQTDNIQYSLIKSQFECIRDYLSWEITFYKSYSANGRDDLKNNSQAIAELTEIGKAL